ncbi:MAG: flippase-like domain-containing protein [Rhizobiales bacterium]|nr:flippase-like domain-containing protein [Hyphomicrobiales bacterium]MDQ3558471.1 flippase-like domain-containing protein [Pseudomonadota bacterium]
MTDLVAASRNRRRWLPWVGGLLGIAALAWVLRGFDLDRFLAVLAGADARFVALVPLAIMGEQFVRAWKWRQLLSPLRPVPTLYLFGAIMAGYLLAILVPFGFGTVARSWLVARRENLKLVSVLATVALDRLTDGIVFACLVPVALISVAFPDPTGGVRAGLIWGGAGSFVLFALALAALIAYRRGALSADGRLAQLLGRLPARAAEPARRLAAAFAEGLAWPRETWRGIGIVLASLAIKLIAATHFLWASLALGVALEPGQYLFLLVFLGFLIILGHFARVAGSFVIGAVFALGLFGVEEEKALAMVLIVEAANLLSIAAIGAIALWAQGVAVGELREGSGARLRSRSPR